MSGRAVFDYLAAEQVAPWAEYDEGQAGQFARAFDLYQRTLRGQDAVSSKEHTQSAERRGSRLLSPRQGPSCCCIRQLWQAPAGPTLAALARLLLSRAPGPMHVPLIP